MTVEVNIKPYVDNIDILFVFNGSWSKVTKITKRKEQVWGRWRTGTVVASLDPES